MGEVPEWYTVIQAAKYLGVAPWDLLEQPVVWLKWAEQSNNAEAAASRQRKESEQRRARARG